MVVHPANGSCGQIVTSIVTECAPTRKGGQFVLTWFPRKMATDKPDCLILFTDRELSENGLSDFALCQALAIVWQSS